ncbi:MAG: 5'-nucleotidase C-terminal domain-containing protein [Desulfobacteraceae bacterium]|nr:5'-nucleotidase C-terminal domain-containing protein [Desulfobacteraceae bacterium]
MSRRFSHEVVAIKKLQLFIIALFLVVSISISSAAAEKVTIIYQNDLHGWLFPSSTRVGMVEIARIVTRVFEKNPNSFYVMAGDLFTGPNLPEGMKGVSGLNMWNHFWGRFAKQGFGERVVISAGNHEFDYGVPAPGSFWSGLLCANLVTGENAPYYVPYRVINCASGFRIGVIGLLMTENERVLTAIRRNRLKMVSMLGAVRRYIPEMGRLDLTVLVVHDQMKNIIRLAEAIPARLGVDVILSGHNHLMFEQPLVENGIYIFQAGAMNDFYGEVDLMISDGRITSMKNRIVKPMPSPLAHVTMAVKETVDELGGKRFAVLKHSLLGAFLRRQENSLGDFVTDAFRWAMGSDVAMTNSSSLRRDFRVYPGESALLNESDFKAMCPFQNHLVVGKVSGVQIMQIIEGDALDVSNQVSGIMYKVDPKRPPGKRVVEAKIGGKPVSLDRVYTLTHNSYCTRPENIKRYLYLEPGSVEWRKTDLIDYKVVIDYARHLKVIDYPSKGKGRIVRVK